MFPCKPCKDPTPYLIGDLSRVERVEAGQSVAAVGAEGQVGGRVHVGLRGEQLVGVLEGNRFEFRAKIDFENDLPSDMKSLDRWSIILRDFLLPCTWFLSFSSQFL